MSGTLGTGYVALTPVNLDLTPAQWEGSKAGLLNLEWALVWTTNAGRYAQPVNLLQLYQTGQFTTPQACLIDNSRVGYPVRLTSISTGHRISCPAYAQVMSPLLVSVAPTFLAELITPSAGKVMDQVTTHVFFLNTPQTPYTIAGDSSLIGSAPGTYTQTVSLTLPAQTVAGATSSANVTLLPAFTQGGSQIVYGSISVQATVTSNSGILSEGGGVGTGHWNIILTLSEGSQTLWQNTQTPWPPSGSNAARTPYTVSNTFASGIVNNDGAATIITATLTPGPLGGTEVLDANTISLAITLAYTTITVPS